MTKGRVEKEGGSEVSVARSGTRVHAETAVAKTRAATVVRTSEAEV